VAGESIAGLLRSGATAAAGLPPASATIVADYLERLRFMNRVRGPGGCRLGSMAWPGARDGGGCRRFLRLCTASSRNVVGPRPCSRLFSRAAASTWSSLSNAGTERCPEEGLGDEGLQPGHGVDRNGCRLPTLDTCLKPFPKESVAVLKELQKRCGEAIHAPLTLPCPALPWCAMKCLVLFLPRRGQHAYPAAALWPQQG
jgi:hypothetical protein